MEDFEQYMADVLSGKIITGGYVKKAVYRHQKDLLRTDVYFDEEAAQYAIDFFVLLNLNTDPDTFEPFVLSPYQKFITGSIFGWKVKRTGFRKYNRAYIEIARKNGKTFFAAGVSLYMMVADGEVSPKSFTGANSKQQAYLCFKDAVNMVRASPALTAEIKVREFDMETRSKAIGGEYRYVSADASKHDGLRPHCAILDEIHEYRTNKLYGIFSSAMVNRTQPLILMITTAGFNKTYWCYREQRKFATQILDEKVDSDNMFAIIYSLDTGDDWRNPDVWIKANPNLGISVRFDALEQEIRTAIIKPEERNNILTKNLNIWENSLTSFLEPVRWETAFEKQKEEDLKGLRCHIGADLSYILDITAYTIAFKLKDGRTYLKHRFFVPKETALLREEVTGTPYMTWISEGHLIGCEGETIDYEQIRKYLLADFKAYGIMTAGFDFYNANHLMEQLNSELPKLYVRTELGKPYTKINPCYGIGQSYGTISPMVDMFLGELYASPQLIVHDGNPVMDWMLGNVVLVYNDEGRKKPSKAKANGKIDGVISTILALEQLNYWADKDIRKNSGIDERGLRTV